MDDLEAFRGLIERVRASDQAVNLVLRTTAKGTTLIAACWNLIHLTPSRETVDKR